MMKRLIILSIALLALANLSKAQNQNLNTAKLDSLFATIETYGKGMGSVSIFQNGKEIYQTSYGYAEVENGVRNSADTKFRIGSITKTFTATIIMKLIEEGKLSLTSVLSEYYPMIPNAEKITIEHLLQHRSGIYNYFGQGEYEWSTKKHTKEQVIDRILSHEPSFSPGEEFEYSNSNYFLLTWIAEEVSSKSFSDLLSELILVPCGLGNTYIGGAIDPTDAEAYSYTKFSSKWKKADETDMSIALGAGFIVSDAYDLNVFFDCLFSGKIVNRESLDSMTSLKGIWGLGLMKVPFYDHVGYGHTGSIDGFQSNAFYFPESKLSIALLENGADYMLNDIVIGCLNIYFEREYKLPVFLMPIEVTSEELDKYLGVYSSPELPIKLTITKKGNVLIVQGTGQPEIPLECTGSDIFEYGAVDLVLEFNTEKNTMIFKQLGHIVEMTR